MKLTRTIVFVSILAVICAMVAFRSCQRGIAQVSDYYFDFGNEAVNTVTGLVVDQTGCWYICGTTEGVLEGDGFGNTDFYVSKFASSGDQLWIKQYGTAADDYASGITVDSTGNVYVCGSTCGDLYTQNASFGVSDIEKEDAYIVKISPNDGSVIWGIQTGTSKSDQFNNILSNGGYLYVVGNSNGSLYLTNPHYASIIVGKFQSNGSIIWGKQLISANGASAYDIDIDSTGNLYICGSSSDLFGTTTGIEDSLVAKLDVSGNLLWGRMYGTVNDDNATSVRVASDGSIYLLETINFTDEAGTGTQVRLNKLNSSGVSVWTRELDSVIPTGSTCFGYDFAGKLVMSNNGDIFISGITDSNMFSTNNGKLDTWVAKYNSSGDRLWSYQFGSSDEEDEMLLASISNNRLLVAGRSGILQNVNEQDSEADIFLKVFEPVSISNYSPVAGTYTGSQTVTLSSSTSGAIIRYTTDGTEPTEQSQVYNSPIAINQTTTVKARAWKDCKITSDIGSAVYVIQ